MDGFYHDQAGGKLDVYGYNQSGGGFGNILGIVRSIIPLAGKLASGFLGDVSSGKNWKTAAKTAAIRGGKQALQSAGTALNDMYDSAGEEEDEYIPPPRPRYARKRPRYSRNRRGTAKRGRYTNF